MRHRLKVGVRDWLVIRSGEYPARFFAGQALEVTANRVRCQLCSSGVFGPAERVRLICRNEIVFVGAEAVAKELAANLNRIAETHDTRVADIEMRYRQSIEPFLIARDDGITDSLKVMIGEVNAFLAQAKGGTT